MDFNQFIQDLAQLKLDTELQRIPDSGSAERWRVIQETITGPISSSIHR